MYWECTPDQTNKVIESTDYSSCTNNRASHRELRLDGAIGDFAEPL